VGRARVLVKDADGARVLVDGKLIASGVREAQIPGVTPGQPHQLRVEVAGRPPFERTFAVAAGAEVDLEVVTAPAAPEPVRPGSRAKKRRDPAGPGSPGVASDKPHHRDGLVGDDIFDKK
jgi:hypothetical protein